MANDGVPDERQTRVIEAIQARSQKLAGMYGTALDLLASEAEPGGAVARVSLICHCMRELMTGLPEALNGFSIPRPRPSSGTLLQKLPGVLAAHPEADLGLDQDLVPVPRDVAQAFASLIGAAAKEEGRNRANVAALMTGSPDAAHPAIDQWLSANRFFVGWAHLDSNHEGRTSLPSDEELLANMRVVEDVVEIRDASFFENLHALEDLLAEINAVDEGNA